MKIIYTQPDGTTAVVAISAQEDVAALVPEVGGMNAAQYVEWIKSRVLPLDATNVQVVEDEDVPVDHAGIIAAAHARINAAYQQAVNDLTAGYPETEIASWPKQEAEARAFLADEDSITPWLSGAATARGINKANFAALVVRNADALAPLHGMLTGKRQRLRDQIDALGDSPTQEQLDAIQWN